MHAKTNPAVTPPTHDWARCFWNTSILGRSSQKSLALTQRLDQSVRGCRLNTKSHFEALNICKCVLALFFCPKSVTTALLSLRMVYPRRNLPAEQWRNAQLLSLLSLPAAMLDPTHCETVSHLYCRSAGESEEESVKVSLKACPAFSSKTHLLLALFSLQSAVFKIFLLSS